MTLAALLKSSFGTVPERRCQRCRFFDDDPHAFEAALPGLTVFSSGMASVRADDGVCHKHGRHARARDVCPAFEPQAVRP